ncbi:MAG TPA: HAMP domain-containing sensor histidine kinase [Asticcacaulis sp.]|nr:HAMP domain-containing sensor histidine kinase [Asticcacaulis sp.]
MPAAQPQFEPDDIRPSPDAHKETPNWTLDPRHSEDRDVARKAFLRMVSHELRTPLNSIIGFSEILCQELYGPLGSSNYLEYAGIIRDSGTRLLSLFNNFIEIVRLESGGDLTPDPQPVLPGLTDAVNKVKHIGAERGVGFHIALRDDGLEAMLDSRGFASCLDQLLHNAIDYTKKGGRIELDARRAGDWVEVTVFNHGNAPDPADVDRLMRPFEQGTSDLNRTRQGAGLGWAIVRLNCLAMGGEFHIDTRKGECLKATLRLRTVGGLFSSP